MIVDKNIKELVFFPSYYSHLDGMIERVNGRIQEVRFTSKVMEKTLMR